MRFTALYFDKAVLRLAEFERSAVILRAEALGVVAAAAKADALRNLGYALVGLGQIVHAAGQTVVHEVLKRRRVIQALEYAAALTAAYVRCGGNVLKGDLLGVVFLNKSAQYAGGIFGEDARLRAAP